MVEARMSLYVYSGKNWIQIQVSIIQRTTKPQNDQRVVCYSCSHRTETAFTISMVWVIVRFIRPLQLPSTNLTSHRMLICVCCVPILFRSLISEFRKIARSYQKSSMCVHDMILALLFICMHISVIDGLSGNDK